MIGSLQSSGYTDFLTVAFDIFEVAKELSVLIIVVLVLYRVPDPEGKLPQESLDALGLKRCFQRKGFS